MKKSYPVIALMLFFAVFTNAQCVIDTTKLATPGVFPAADSLPCIVKNVMYNETIQGRVQQSKDTTLTILGTSYSGTLTVDSASVDTINGLPTGITWTKNPQVIKGGGSGCINFSGTTTDTVGDYALTARGRVWFNITGGPLTNYKYQYHGDLNQFSPFGNYHLTVVAQASDCTHLTDVRNLNAELAAALSVYPNPTSGAFELKLNAANRITGDVVIVDMTGRMVYSQKVDAAGIYTTTINLSKFAKGLYTLQLRTAEGFTSKNISVE